jgi:dTDP-4-dehydrorhamnose reductase
MKNISFDKILITGADGMVGSYVDFGIKTNRQSLDITTAKETLSVIEKYKPDAILHLAAMTDVDQCERDPSGAYLVNGIGAYHVALAARQCSAKMIYISTAGVFDGEKNGPYAEEDIPNPQNYYGYSKFLGEAVVRGVLEDHLIIRTCWMMGGGPAKDKKFVAKIIAQLAKPETKEINAVNDQIGSPSYAKDLVVAIKELIRQDAKGIYHLAGAASASRFDVAKKIVALVRPDVKVNPVPTSFFNLDAKRTVNEVLSSKVNLMRPWDEAVEDYVRTEWIEIISH